MFFYFLFSLLVKNQFCVVKHHVLGKFGSPIYLPLSTSVLNARLSQIAKSGINSTVLYRQHAVMPLFIF